MLAKSIILIKNMKSVKKILLICLIIFGAFWTMAFFTRFENGKMPEAVDYAILIIFGLIPVGSGIWRLMILNQTTAQLHEHNMDTKIILLAKKQGKITTLDLVTEFHFTVDNAKKELEDLYAKGVFTVEVGEDGGIYYQLNKGL